MQEEPRVLGNALWDLWLLKQPEFLPSYQQFPLSCSAPYDKSTLGLSQFREQLLPAH